MSLQPKDYTAAQAYDDYTPTDKVSEFGGELDLWGIGDVTAEDLNDPTLEVVFDADLGSGIIRADDVSMEVFFTTPYTYSPEGTPHNATKNNSCTIGANPEGKVLLVIAGMQGAVWVSEDRGQNWQEVDTGIVDTIWVVRWSPKGFIACGDNGVILQSLDALDWEETRLETSGAIFAAGVARSVEQRVIAGKGGIRREEGNEWRPGYVTR